MNRVDSRPHSNSVFRADNLIMPHSKNNLLLFSCWDAQIDNICISTPKNTGTTTSILLYIFQLCCSIPSFSVIAATEKYTSIHREIIDVLETNILGYKVKNLKSHIQFAGSESSRNERIKFANGSEICFMSLSSKNTLKKIEDSETNLFWLNKASEIYEFDKWRAVSRRLLEQSNQTQIILETYPKSPKHWIYKLFHTHKQSLFDLDDSKDFVIMEHAKKCGSKIWINFTHDDNPAFLYTNPFWQIQCAQLLRHISFVLSKDGNIQWI